MLSPLRRSLRCPSGCGECTSSQRGMTFKCLLPAHQSHCCDIVDGLRWALTEMSAWNWTLSCIYIGLINSMTLGDQGQPSAHPERGLPEEKNYLEPNSRRQRPPGYGMRGITLQVRASVMWPSTLCLYEACPSHLSGRATHVHLFSCTIFLPSHPTLHSFSALFFLGT